MILWRNGNIKTNIRNYNVQIMKPLTLFTRSLQLLLTTNKYYYDKNIYLF